MRVTALKLLKKMGFESALRETYGEIDLTDVERDELLRIVYMSDYPKEEPEATFRGRLHMWEQEIKTRLLQYVANDCAGDTTERERWQLATLQTKSQATVEGLLKGTIQPINAYTEPTAEIPEGQDEGEVMHYARMMQAIMGNEFKQELYLVMCEAEKQNDTAVVDLLTPVFLTPDYPLDERAYNQLVECIRIGSKSLRAERMDVIRGTKQTGMGLDPKDMKEVEGEFHSKDNPGGMLR
jgi:hypothetical protein